MDRDMEEHSHENLRQLRAADLIAGASKAETLPSAESIQVLDVPAARAALNDAGLEVPDLDKVADHLADGGRFVHPSNPYDAAPGEVMTFGALFVGAGGGMWGIRWLIMQPTTDYGFPEELQGPMEILKIAAIFAAILGVLLVGLGAISISWKRGPEREVQSAVEILKTHLTNVSMPTAYAEVVAAAVKAEETIVGTDVWSTGLFDSHHVRLGLSAEVDLIASRMRRLTAITHGTDTSEADSSNKGHRFFRGLVSERATGDKTTVQAVQQIKAATLQRVAALEEYRDQVLACDHEYRRLQAAETAEMNASRLTDLLASTGADQAQIDHLKTLSLEAAAATDALRDVLALMTGTVSTLSLDRSSKS
ncbi:hypothetical protein ACFVBP_10355 [Nocardioides sp. NPDC057764]|uniref:hypothetical protein n=1 Tax=Nocardioides sp. NPDC057764 TaxID=3346243 RepID=UPI00367120FA